MNISGLVRSLLHCKLSDFIFQHTKNVNKQKFSKRLLVILRRYDKFQLDNGFSMDLDLMQDIVHAIITERGKFICSNILSFYHIALLWILKSMILRGLSFRNSCF